MNVSNSTTPTGERLTDTRRKIQWEHINWKTVTDSVNQLQIRITKAVNKEKWQLVKRLQYMLTHSFYAKLLAIKKVTQNKGARTAGIDGEKWITPKAKIKAALTLSDKNYKSKPSRRVYIEKHGKKEKRPLSIPTIHDRAMQALYALALNPLAEATADRTSFGFRKNRSTHDACAQGFVCLSGKHSAQWVLEGDIKGCFDNINHEWLLDNIPMDKSILKQFLKAGFVYNRHLNPSKSGTPQGGIISPILANMTLDGIEALIASKYYTSKTGKVDKGYDRHKINFVRYADDFIVTADSEDTAKEIEELIKPFLKERGLELSESKTLISHIDDGFDFLGWNFRKYKGKLLIKPSRDSIDKITKKISEVIKGGKAWTQEHLISILNPIITGWANYHQSVVSKEIFSNLDNRLWGMLWKWAKRRHSNKSKSWIADKYWHKMRRRKWAFSTEGNELKLFSDTKIVRYPNLKLGMNPYLDEEYFDLRRYKISLRRSVNKTIVA